MNKEEVSSIREFVQTSFMDGHLDKHPYFFPRNRSKFTDIFCNIDHYLLLSELLNCWEDYPPHPLVSSPLIVNMLGLDFNEETSTKIKVRGG